MKENYRYLTIVIQKSFNKQKTIFNFNMHYLTEDVAESELVCLEQ